MTDVKTQRKNQYASSALAELDRQMMEEILDPATSSVLINIDWQRDYVSPEGKCNKLWHQSIDLAQEALPRAQAVTDAFRALEKPVVFTQNFENIGGRNKARMARAIRHEKVATPEDEELGVAAVRGTPGADIIMDVKPEERVFEKTGQSAYTQEMKDYIKESGAKVVFLTGVRTNRCVLATLIDMYNDADVYVVVLTDAIATDKPELDILLKKEIEEFYPPVLTTTELLDAWKNALAKHPSVHVKAAD